MYTTGIMNERVAKRVTVVRDRAWVCFLLQDRGKLKLKALLIKEE
jgi:hypothetical protein